MYAISTVFSSINNNLPFPSHESQLLPSSGSARPLRVPTTPWGKDLPANPADRRGDGQTPPAPRSRPLREGHRPAAGPWGGGKRAGAAPGAPR